MKKTQMKRLIITEEEKRQIRKSYGLNEASLELDVFPIQGSKYDIGWDQALQDKLNKGDTSFSNPIQNSDFSETPTNAGAGGHKQGHKGVDIFAPKGTPVLAPVSGLVKYNDSNGNTIIIKDLESGFSHWLGHLDSRTVKDGSMVEAGQQVGTVGNTGNAVGTSPHLHYNIYKTFLGFQFGKDPFDTLKKAIGKTSKTKTDSEDQYQSILKQIFGVDDSSNEKKLEASDEKDLWNILKSAGNSFLKNLFK